MYRQEIIKETEKEYRSYDALSQSFVKAFDRSPAHAFTYRESTSAMDFGSALHCYILQPELFAELYIVTDLDGRTKEYKALKEANPDKTIIKSDDHNAMIDMKSRLLQMKFEGKPMIDILSVASKEISAYWISENLQCKGLIDILYNDLNCNVIFDLKTIDNADQFYWNVRNYGYDRQAAWYIEGLQSNYENPARFIFIVMEKQVPYGVKFYELDTGSLLNAHYKNQKTLEKYTEWLINGADKTICYSDEVNIIRGLS